MARRQGLIWLLTIPQAEFVPYCPPQANYVKGQLELGAGQFLHWQLIVYFRSKQSLRGVREIFGPFHAELTRSAAAEDYVWKEETRVDGTQFECGIKPLNRANANDWEQIWQSAIAGDFSRH